MCGMCVLDGQPTQSHKEIHLRTGSDILECHRRWKGVGEKVHSDGNKGNTCASSARQNLIRFRWKGL